MGLLTDEGTALPGCFIAVSDTLAVDVVFETVLFSGEEVVIRFSGAQKSNKSYAGY
jgi:hypothetical protein